MQKKLLICLLTFVRPRDVQIIYGVSRQSVWRYVREGRLAPPIKISPGICGWDRATLDSFFGITPDAVNNLTSVGERLVSDEVGPTNVGNSKQKRGHR
jgi:predicted DNA-binding transcriptional regulator AlpA